MNKPVKNGQLTGSLYRSLRNAKAIANIPGLLRQIFEMRSWEELLVDVTGEIVSFGSFTEYVTTPPPEGLGTKVESIRDLIPRDDMELLAMFDEETQGKPGGDKRSDKYKTITYNISNGIDEVAKNGGTSAQAGLRRLRKLAEKGNDRAKVLRQKVFENEVSVNAALIELGVRTKTITVPLDPERAARSIRRHFDDEQLEQLIEQLRKDQ